MIRYGPYIGVSSLDKASFRLSICRTTRAGGQETRYRNFGVCHTAANGDTSSSSIVSSLKHIQLDLDTGLLGCDIVYFLSPPAGKFWDSTSIRPLPLLSRSFPIHYHSSFVLPPDTIYIVLVLKAELNDNRNTPCRIVGGYQRFGGTCRL
jgi:hypothetical protein